MDIDIEKFKQDIETWANTIPYGMALFLFGSYLKGKPDPSDIDIAIIFTESLSRSEIENIIYDHHASWEVELKKITDLPIHLQICNPGYSVKILEYLKKGPMIRLCVSEAQENDDGDFLKSLDVLLNTRE